tara:strand:+ start:130 stop:2214 length:2085 start_codon:yes stop_codon:yes gene_type:complete
MSLKIRDTLNNSGADNNPDHVGRTQLDNLNNSDTTLGNGSSSFLNPDFNPTELLINEQFPPGAFPQVSSTIHVQWNTLAYMGTEELIGIDNIVDYFLQYFPTLAQSDTKSDIERLGGVANIIKNNEGLFIWPEFNFDGIGSLEPGQGYQIRVKDVPLQPNGQSLNFTTITIAHNITKYENHPDFTSYLNALNNLQVPLHTQWNTIGFARFTPQPVRKAFYKYFFPNGSDGHLINDEGLPYDSIHPADIQGFVVPYDQLGETIEYAKSRNGSTGSCESTIHNIYAHPTITESAATTLLRIKYDGRVGSTFNFRAMDDSLISLHEDVQYPGSQTDQKDRDNLFHFSAGSTPLEGTTNLAEKIYSVLNTRDDTGTFPLTSSVSVDGSDIKLKIQSSIRGKDSATLISSSFGGYLENGTLASGSFNPETINENNTIFKFEVGSEEYLFKGFRVSSSAEQDAREVYNNVDNQFAFNTSQTPNNVLDRKDPENHNISNNKKIDNLIKRVNEQNLVKINFNTNFKTNSDGSIQVNDNGAGIIDYSKITSIARNTAEDFNGIKIKKSTNNGSSYSTKTTLANGILKGFFELNRTKGGKDRWGGNVINDPTTQTQNSTLIDMRLGDLLNIVKNNEGLFYWPEFDFDGIVMLEPGQGYQVRVKDNTYSGEYKIDPRGEIKFEYSNAFPPDEVINTDPLIDGGPE